LSRLTANHEHHEGMGFAVFVISRWP
jgi:hypothetical protein